MKSAKHTGTCDEYEPEKGGLRMQMTKQKLTVRSLRRTDFVEVGRDLFDQKTSEIISEIGEKNIIQILPLNYEHIDMSTRQKITDYGIIVISRESEE